MCTMINTWAKLRHVRSIPSLHLQVLLAGSATDFALFAEEIQHTPQDGQQQDADDDHCNNNTTAALWWRRSTRTTAGLPTLTGLLNEMAVYEVRGSDTGSGRQAVQHSTVCSYSIQLI